MTIRKFWIWLILVPVGAFALLVTFGNQVVIRQHKTQVDMNSGRLRTLDRHFWTVTEGLPQDTWVSLALRATRKEELPPSWKSQNTETDTLFGKTFACNPGGPVSSLFTGNYYSHRFTPEALAIIAADLLRYSGGKSEDRRRWRQFEGAVEKALRETPEDTLIDETWVRATHERHFGSGG
jgi:hypothetical protein